MPYHSLQPIRLYLWSQPERGVVTRDVCVVHVEDLKGGIQKVAAGLSVAYDVFLTFKLESFLSEVIVNKVLTFILSRCFPYNPM